MNYDEMLKLAEECMIDLSKERRALVKLLDKADEQTDEYANIQERLEGISKAFKE